MAKGQLLEDTFEKLVELGQSTAKNTVKSVASTLNPFSSLTKQGGGRTSEVEESRLGRDKLRGESSEVKLKGKNHTPVDFEKLKNKFQDKEKLKVEGLRNRLFQMVKNQEERSLIEKRQKEMEKKRQEVLAEQDKKRKEEEKRKQQAYSNVPRGKARRSIFSQKKAAEQQHAETKPATGKQ